MGKKNAKSEIFAWLADLERAAGDLDGALQRVNGGLTLYPHDVAAMIVRAKILFQQEKFEECVQQCEAILVKDPFSLAGQKIMGDAFEKLEKIPERNLCYRRYHDMDPLNNFWKDEYDVVPDAAAATAVVGAVSSMSDEEFSMPDLNASVLPGNVKTLEELEAENAAAMGENAQEISMGGLFKDDEDSSVENSFEEAFGNTFGSLEEDSSAEGGLFEKSASSVGISLDDESTSEDSANPFSSADAVMSGFKSDENVESFGEAPFASETTSQDDVEGDDPFAALAAMLPNSDAAEDSMMDELSQSLNATMAEIAVSSIDEKPVEEFPVDENISSNDVNSAMSNFFGMEEEVDEEESTGAGPTSTSENEEDSLDFGAPAEDKPTSVDNAFNDIFGEDELPEELPQAAPVEEDKPTSVDNAFNDIFGEDELPEEKPQAASAELDIPADLELPSEGMESLDSLELPVDDLPVNEPVASDDFTFIDETPSENNSLNVDNAFDSIFGAEEGLPVEPSDPVSEVSTPSEPALTSAMDFVLEDEPSEAPAEENECVPAVEESTAADAPAASSFSVDSAFDSLFGDDDDLPVEDSVNRVAEDPAVPVVEDSASLAEQVDLAESELEMPPSSQAPSSNLAQEMGGAFASMFGDQDDDLDLPELNETAPIENNVVDGSSLDQQATSAAFEEAASETQGSDLDKSFSDLFGSDDDDLTLPVEESVSADIAMEQAAPQAPAVAGVDSLESELSGAFKGLFDMDDDSMSLSEDKPSNSGVDFLMSGDSDDEVSAGLIDNPEAPLNRGAQDIDESLNTKTLAEIYFDQGLYGKALEIYSDLAQKEPDNQEITNRYAEIEKIYREKFGGNG